MKSWFAEPGDDDSLDVDRLFVVHSAKKKLKWLQSLDDSVEKAMADHEIGEEVKTLVRSWATVADKLDKT